MGLEKKYDELKNILRKLEKVVIAYSGGVDSTFLLKVACDELGENVLAVTVDTPMYPKSEKELAIKIGKEIGVTHEILEIKEGNEIIKFNPEDRCYVCKKNIFKNIKEIGEKNYIENILDGSNTDDLKTYRPGKKALEELEIISPLVLANLNKLEIRKLSKKLELETHNKPSFSCLMTRFEYGEEVTKEKLKEIENCENFLKEIGFKNYRVRKHKHIARIEVDKDERVKFFNIEIFDKVNKYFKSQGFKYVTVDLDGYISGSMDIDIKK